MSILEKWSKRREALKSKWMTTSSRLFPPKHWCKKQPMLFKLIFITIKNNMSVWILLVSWYSQRYCIQTGVIPLKDLHFLYLQCLDSNCDKTRHPSRVSIRFYHLHLPFFFFFLPPLLWCNKIKEKINSTQHFIKVVNFTNFFVPLTWRRLWWRLLIHVAILEFNRGQVVQIVLTVRYQYSGHMPRKTTYLYTACMVWSTCQQSN